MISSTLAAMSNSLRRAAGRRAYAEVERLVTSLCDAAAAEARSVPAGDPQIREIAAWLDQQLESTRVILRIARTAHADELRRIPFLKRYMNQPARKRACLQLDL
jgi:hypothetical protein